MRLVIITQHFFCRCVHLSNLCRFPDSRQGFLHQNVLVGIVTSQWSSTPIGRVWISMSVVKGHSWVGLPAGRFQLLSDTAGDVKRSEALSMADNELGSTPLVWNKSKSQNRRRGGWQHGSLQLFNRSPHQCPGTTAILSSVIPANNRHELCHPCFQ